MLPIMLSSMPSAKSWIGLLLMGVFQLALPDLLLAKAIKHVTALEAILLMGIEPILNPLWVLLLNGETPGPWALVGGILVLGSVMTRSILLEWGHK